MPTRVNAYYCPQHFDVREFVPPETYKIHGDSSLMFIDERLLRTMDLIRDWFNRPVVINNWNTGGHLQYRGYRPPECKEGAAESQHRFGRACDFDVEGLSAEAARKILLDHQSDASFQFIRRIELGTSWVHIDLANVDSVNIYTFTP
jgi:hypothetical protein